MALLLIEETALPTTLGQRVGDSEPITRDVLRRTCFGSHRPPPRGATHRALPCRRRNARLAPHSHRPHIPQSAWRRRSS